MSELDKLEKYLIEKGFDFFREDENGEYWEKHQIVVYDKNGERQWDAICQRGSYGFQEGLIEIYGTIVTEEDGDSVCGWLTADDVIKRIENRFVAG
jgi:hypothetical protein